MTQAFDTDDLHLHAKVTSLHAVPGGATGVCSVRTVDREQNQYVSALWRCPMDGGPPEPLTEGAHLDTSPALSPDSHWVAFLSDRFDHEVAGRKGLEPADDFDAPQARIRVFLLDPAFFDQLAKRLTD